VVVGDVVQAVPALDNPIVAASIWEQILTAARVQFDYLKLLVIPVGLSTDYSYQQIPVVSTWMNGRVLGFVALMLGGVVLGFGLRKRYRVVLYCVVGYGILFVPTSNFILPIGTIMAERLVYSPSLFFCLLLGYGLWSVSRSRLAWFTMCVILVFYSGLTLARNRTWSQEDIFFETQVQSAPASAKAHYNLGRIQQAAGLSDDALDHYEQAVEAFLMVIRLSPGYVRAYENLSIIYFDAGRMAEAEAVFQEILQRDPDNIQARMKLSVLEKRR
jgi:tetratricopeptide (TPR) repeat protein